mgnify:CR=1 FL=1
MEDKTKLKEYKAKLKEYLQKDIFFYLYLENRMLPLIPFSSVYKPPMP